MPVRRRSRWQSRRSDWYREAALTEIRSSTSEVTFTCAALSLLGFAYGISRLGEPVAWAFLASGLAAAVLALGLWYGHAWAGRLAGVLAALVAVGGLVSLFTVGRDSAWWWLESLYVVPIWAGVAVFLLRPSSRRYFRQARTGAPDRTVPRPSSTDSPGGAEHSKGAAGESVEDGRGTVRSGDLTASTPDPRRS